jgi:hypothetical protein
MPYPPVCIITFLFLLHIFSQQQQHQNNKKSTNSSELAIRTKMASNGKGKNGRRLSGVIKQDAANSGVANLIGTVNIVSPYCYIDIIETS